MLNQLSDTQTRQVEFASKYQFKGHISVSTIYRWLGNFKEEELPAALKMLEHIEYFSSTDLSTILKSHLERFISPENTFSAPTCIHFIPLGKPGKSGFVILYLIKNLFKEKYANRLQPPRFYSSPSEVDVDSLSERDIVFFVDDITGSGDTFLSIVCTDEEKQALGINPILKSNENAVRLCRPGQPHQVIVLSCIIMDKAIERINRVLPHIKVLGETRQKIFDKDKSPFHSYKTILETREIAYKYGMELIGDKSRALGYSNSQAMIIFEHATPNNTLPIIWKGADEENFRWYPIRARSHRDRISYAIDDREFNNQWLIRLSRLFGVEPEELRGSNLISKENYDIALILRLIRSGLTDMEIAIVMGLPLKQFDSIKEKGCELGFWNEDLSLNTNAKRTMTEIEKYLSLFPIPKPQEEPYDDCDTMYIPPTFGGIS